MAAMKTFLFTLNFIIFIGGCMLIGLASFALNDHVSSLGKILGSQLLTGSIYILLGVGICVTLIAFFGCCGAWREVKCMLLIYFVVVFVFFIALLGAGISAYVFKEHAFEKLEIHLQASTNEYKSNPVVKDAWNDIQNYWKCCGVTGGHKEAYMFPYLCCKSRDSLRNTGCFFGTTFRAGYPGCLTKTKEFIEKHSTEVAISGIVLAVILFFCSMFAFALFLKI